MNNLAVSTPSLCEEFYSLSNGRTLARVEMNGDALSHIVVTDGASEGIDNRVYMRILGSDANQISREQYDAMRTAMQKRQLRLVCSH